MFQDRMVDTTHGLCWEKPGCEGKGCQGRKEFGEAMCGEVALGAALLDSVKMAEDCTAMRRVLE